MWLKVDPALKDEFPELRSLVFTIEAVRVDRISEELEEFKAKAMEDVKKNYRLETVKDQPILRAYRDFFWRIGIDPTKVRPAAEALIRRILGGKPLPTINTLVDAYNLASIKSCIALGAFDMNNIRGELIMRRAKPAEEFLGIGMKSPIQLDGNEIVVGDKEKLIAIYPYRDSDETKVTERTKNVLFLSCGVPRISEEKLREASELTAEYVTKFCGGIVKL